MIARTFQEVRWYGVKEGSGTIKEPYKETWADDGPEASSAHRINYYLSERMSAFLDSIPHPLLARVPPFPSPINVTWEPSTMPTAIARTQSDANSRMTVWISSLRRRYSYGGMQAGECLGTAFPHLFYIFLLILIMNYDPTRRR
jgi:hypothetical protein